MNRCQNMVTQYVPSGYGYKPVLLRCGSTSIDGGVLLCDACQAKADRAHPQGWREVPGDLCRHGNYVGDAGGPDYICEECEGE